MNDMEDCSRKWAKREGVDDSALSEWVKAIKHLVKRHLYFVNEIICHIQLYVTIITVLNQDNRNGRYGYQNMATAVTVRVVTCGFL